MMIKIAAILCLIGASTTSAFAPTTIATSTKYDVSLEMSNSNRRQVLLQSGVGLMSAFSIPMQALAEPRPTYLTEPTDEFKQNEAKAMEFRRQQLEQKKKFTTVLDKLQTSSTEKDLVDNLQDLRSLVVQTAGLPGGLKKDDVIKQVRAKKAKGFWPTNVEIAYVANVWKDGMKCFLLLLVVCFSLFRIIRSFLFPFILYSYQDLIGEIRFQQSPNTEKDMGNPL